ncbi:CDP-diacylglycerol--glycerol-3-phosphate 3-phosphatidyltransferase [Rathayibacter tritici]|uniref:CDP-diacylglycerol--glycerol-3-phosphate 3-phosphatidyltransferase n=1 Tax=Rathayibacter tritici TaxID=33888 RepID=A0A169BWP4_9MICO|nr:CDP-diacylglycerol--glycerol-3-phosphate 3-phosphatidyltransferase [Rathayibacter tritici]AND16145.1 CDP-diacylglycerol--glycerol-3-phosphate 3-phosphatidyltransferase [Rathayibacter tritici]PPF28888.1 CDP-diacylglycerol--glycerol-3-phosphate 3-phosphatidyltransferase [Rathayibacter tritici]PPF66808.1 CDP-diacylglycerol--glycerol-3-phosphate 3-phosphatidyltransferase [Rathayibacter tritici]PPG06923.1 CDP-diacylglycerol--glycerol-3-phosphate 3-phosphatidyltransferase [Rathayibacter tritici]P
MSTPTAPASARSGNWNLPNAITVVRILLAPIFLWLLLADGGQDGGLRIAAALLFIVAIATDGIDGHIARSRGLVTDLGKLLDPIADKVLTGAALVGLSILAELPWWVTVVILVREIGITVFRMAVLSDRVIPASRGGKLKTIVQSVAISLALLPLWAVLGEWVHWLNGVTMTAAVVLTVLTGIDYLADAARQSRASRPKP